MAVTLTYWRLWWDSSLCVVAGRACSNYSYLGMLLDYLLVWYRRAKPLTNVDGLIKDAEEQFEKYWAEGNWNWERIESEEKARESTKGLDQIKREPSVHHWLHTPM